jgi:serine O-acetyltransferase
MRYGRRRLIYNDTVLIIGLDDPPYTRYGTVPMDPTSAFPLNDISNIEIADWTRETPAQFWDPGRKLLLCIRSYQRWQPRTGILARIFRKWIVLRHRFWSVVTGADIPLNCNIGGGLLIPHPNGIVIHPSAKIGVNCLIFQQVTIGGRAGGGLPVIGDHVDIGAGAKILGPVLIGDRARIGANAVIVKNVESGSVAVGILHGSEA